MTYRLYYWSTIQGRGEFVRLALEDTGLEYEDVARGDEGDEASMAIIGGPEIARPPFAPPFLRTPDGLLIGQSANILQYLGERHGLAPQDVAGRYWTQQLQLTIADLVAEAHDTHHPVGNGLYYEDQKQEALRRSKEFREQRIPKFLGWFERILARNPSGPDWLVSDQATYADLSLFQVVAGLRYAFPKAMKCAESKLPHVVALHDRVKARPRLAAYLASDRRLPFGEEGIFRRYPELDG